MSLCSFQRHRTVRTRHCGQLGAYGHGERRRLPPPRERAAPLYEQDNHNASPGQTWWQQPGRTSAITVSMVHGEYHQRHLRRCGRLWPGGKGRRNNFTCGRHVHLSRRRMNIPVAGWGIDFWCPAPTKCIQGVPGFFLHPGQPGLEASAGQARSLALDPQ